MRFQLSAGTVSAVVLDRGRVVLTMLYILLLVDTCLLNYMFEFLSILRLGLSQCTEVRYLV